MQQPWTGLCEDGLSDHRRTRRLDRSDAHIIEIVPFFGMREKTPDDLHWRIDDAGRATRVNDVGLWALRINSEIATRVELELVKFEIKKPGWGERRKLIERLLNEWLRDGAIFPDIKILKPATTKRWDIRLDASLAALVEMQLVNPSTGKPEWGDRKQLIEALLLQWLKSDTAKHYTYLLPRSDVEEAHQQAIAPPSPAKTQYNEEQILRFAYTVGSGGYADGIAFADAVRHRDKACSAVDLLNSSPKLRNFMHREMEKALTISKYTNDPDFSSIKSGRVAHRRAAQKEKAAFRADLAARRERVVSLAEERLSFLEEELNRSHPIFWRINRSRRRVRGIEY
jgi:hypothetical protein